MTTYKAKILWHELWLNGPIVGVCSYNDEMMIFARNAQGMYDIRRFKEGGYQKALENHLSYRAKYGGIRDHDPRYYSMTKREKASDIVATTKTFDYYENGLPEIVDTLHESDFEWFYPPRNLKMNIVRGDDYKQGEVFVPSEGKDII